MFYTVFIPVNLERRILRMNGTESLGNVSRSELKRLKAAQSKALESALTEAQETFPRDSKVLWNTEAKKEGATLDGDLIVCGHYISGGVVHLTVTNGSTEVSKPATVFAKA